MGLPQLFIINTNLKVIMTIFKDFIMNPFYDKKKKEKSAWITRKY